MFVRWQWWGQRRRKTVRYYWSQPADAHAVLVESVRIDGKPRQRHIAYLGSVHHDPDVHYRAWWWHHMTARLDALGNRLPPDERPKIEAALADKVPPVTAAEVAAYDLHRQHDVRVVRGYGECRGCYMRWPPGQAGVPPRPPPFDRDATAEEQAAAIESVVALIAKVEKGKRA